MNYVRLLSIIALGYLLMLASFATAQAGDKDIMDQKKELIRVQKEVEQSQKRLDSLKDAEVGVQKQLSEFDQKIASNRKVIQRLTRESRELKNAISHAADDLSARQESYDRTRRRFLGGLRQLYFSTRRQDMSLVGDPDQECERERQIKYLSALANFESKNVTEAHDYVNSAIETKASLVSESDKIASLKKAKETSTKLEATRKQKTQGELEKLQRRKLSMVDEMLTLQQAAREMEEIVERLERSRQQSEQERPSPENSVFATLQGKLTAPFRGKIIQRFGEIVDPITNLRSFSPGIIIKGRPGGNVSAVSSGTVAYVGNLRGYGNFIIINHDDVYYSTYAGLGQTQVKKDQYVRSGTVLATSADDGQLRFELRQGSKPLDPVEWIRLDSF